LQPWSHNQLAGLKTLRAIAQNSRGYLNAVVSRREPFLSVRQQSAMTTLWDNIFLGSYLEERSITEKTA
jgi:hypothetical protein